MIANSDSTSQRGNLLAYARACQYYSIRTLLLLQCTGGGTYGYFTTTNYKVWCTLADNDSQ